MGVAKELARLSGDERPVMAGKLTEAVKKAEAALGIKFAPSQEQAIRQAVQQGITVITGGPGTGKSTIVSGLIQVLSELEPGFVFHWQRYWTGSSATNGPYRL